MQVKITQSGKYADYEKQPGYVKSQHLDVGAVVDFPTDYAQGIIKSGLAVAVGATQKPTELPEPVDAPKVVQAEKIEAAIDYDNINATSSAIDLAKENGIDLSDVEGSGREGRITKADVVALVD